MTKFSKSIVILCLLLLPLTTSANIIRPSIYIEQGMLSRMVIIPGLIIEFLFIKIFAKTSRIKSGIMAVSMNAISTLIGRVGIPVSGFALEILLSVFGATTTFHISHWIGAFLLALTLNVVIEGLSLKRIFALPFKKNLWWLALANTISILICASLLIFGVIK